jgi:hypothetical protein
MYYMTSAFYTPGAASGVRFNDPAFCIKWPLAVTLVSEQDRNWPLLAAAGQPLHRTPEHLPGASVCRPQPERSRT